MDQEYIASKAKGVLRVRGEKVNSYLARVSHISLQGEKLKTLNGIEAATGCSTLYCYDNRVVDLTPISRLRKLISLYLDNNNVTSLLGLATPPLPAPKASFGVAAPSEPISTFCPIEKLFLKGNAISRIHAAVARALPNLHELHLPAQRLPPGQGAIFLEPAALQAWSRSLLVLDVSLCGLTSLRHLSALYNLRTLKAGDNPVEDLEDAVESIRQLPCLETLEVKGCTFSLPGAGGRPQGRYRDALVAASCPSLVSIDGLEVTAAHRSFMKIKMEKSVARVASSAASQYLASRVLLKNQQQQQQQQPSSVTEPPGTGGHATHATTSINFPGWEEEEDEEEEDSSPLDSQYGSQTSFSEDLMSGEENNRERAPEDSANASGEANGGDQSMLGETLSGERAGEVRRASLGLTASAASGMFEESGDTGGVAGAENLPPRHPPLPPLRIHAESTPTASTFQIKVGDLSGFQSTINLSASMYSDAPPPSKDPQDFDKGSRWIGGFSKNSDRERARITRERAREEAEMARRLAVSTKGR